MKVRRVFHPNAVCIEPWESIHDAARRMHSGGYGCLAVTSGEDLLGILTEHDVVEAVAKDDHPETATVFEYMTDAPVTVEADEDCAAAAAEMLALGCRHLPVVDHGRLVGIVSSRDLLPLAATAAGA